MKKCACGRVAEKGRTKCRRCRYRDRKRRATWRVAFQYHRANAKRRGIRFLLSFDEFMAVWEAEPEKMAEKEASLVTVGETCSWEIDRIDPALGYEVGNLQLVTKVVNVLRRWYGDGYQIQVYKSEPGWADDVPF